MNKSFTISNNDIFDGYHTFGDLYEHRAALFLALGAASGWQAYWRKDGEGWLIVFLETPAGQVSYHLPAKYLEQVKRFAAEASDAYKWDGHNSVEVLDRLLASVVAAIGKTPKERALQIQIEKLEQALEEKCAEIQGAERRIETLREMLEEAKGFIGEPAPVEERIEQLKYAFRYCFLTLGYYGTDYNYNENRKLTGIDADLGQQAKEALNRFRSLAHEIDKSIPEGPIEEIIPLPPIGSRAAELAIEVMALQEKLEEAREGLQYYSKVCKSGMADFGEKADKILASMAGYEASVKLSKVIDAADEALSALLLANDNGVPFEKYGLGGIDLAMIARAEAARKVLREICRGDDDAQAKA